MPTPNPNGFPDSYFINWIRRKLRDQPAWIPETIPTTGTDGVNTVAGAKPYRTQRAPVVAAGVQLTAPSPTNAGITNYGPVYDVTDPAPLAPTVIDGGAGGTLAAGTYQVYLSYAYAAGESGPGLLSAPITIVANHLLSVTYPGVVPAGVLAVRLFLLPTSAGASVGGFISQDNVPIAGRSISAPGTGVATVLINTDTGELVFAVPPAVGNLNITYQAERFSDTQILNALTDGMKAMYPQIWQLAQDTSLAPSPVLYEYVLPAVFGDMRVVLLEVELRIPNIQIIPFKRYKRWRRAGPLTLAFMDRFSPAGVIRLNYNAPYSVLADVDLIAMHLPCYYAMGLLLKEQEAMRTRATEMVPQTGEGGVKSGDATATSRDWFDTFEHELERLGRPQPIRSDAPQEHEMYA